MLRLFLSADLENSTRLKQSSEALDRPWLAALLNFVHDFPQIFDGALQKYRRDEGLETIPNPRIWKVLGDELVFVASLNKKPDCGAIVDAFRTALQQWNEQTPTHSAQILLKVKGSAWIAGFPVANAAIPTGDDGREDYFGPSIDLGFRIGKLSTTRKMAISVDLAWLLLASDYPKVIHFDGPALLKGVAEETGYPLLWLEVGQSNFLNLSHELLGRAGQHALKNMKEFCEAFIEEFGVPTYPPFIPSLEELTPQPDSYEEELRKARRFFRESVYFVDEDPIAPGSPRPDVEEKSLLDAAQAG